MVVGFFTNPLQGAAFIKFRDLIMGNVSHDFLANSTQQTFETPTPSSVLGDVPCVGRSDVSKLMNEEAQPGWRLLGAIMRKVGAEEGWTTINRKKKRKDIIKRREP